MYTKRMHERIRVFCSRHYAEKLLLEDGGIQRELTVSDVEELLEKINELEEDVEYYKSECLNRS